MRHRWLPVLYNRFGEECGWLCSRCGLNAQLYPEQHMSDRNDPTAECCVTIRPLDTLPTQLLLFSL